MFFIGKQKKKTPNGLLLDGVPSPGTEVKSVDRYGENGWSPVAGVRTVQSRTGVVSVRSTLQDERASGTRKWVGRA